MAFVVVPWLLWLCRGFCGCAVAFAVVPWHLWASVATYFLGAVWMHTIMKRERREVARSQCNRVPPGTTNNSSSLSKKFQESVYL